jgi:tetratricopeptide (TPR) repeat protein
VAWVHAARGDGAEAVRCAREAVALASVPLARAAATRTLGHALLVAGDAAAAIKVLEQLLSAVVARHPYVHALACLAEAYRMAGEAARGVATARQAADLANAAGSLFNLALAERAVARTTTDEDEARGALDRAIAAFEHSEARFETALTRLDLARWCARHGETATASALVGEILPVLEEAGAPARVAEACALARTLPPITPPDAPPDVSGPSRG